MTLKTRVTGIESRRNAGVREIVRIDPDDWPNMTADEMAGHRANILRATNNPAALLIVMADDGAADPLAELLGPDGPAAMQSRRLTVNIARSYGAPG
jgi:hypothetical protein